MKGMGNWHKICYRYYEREKFFRKEVKTKYFGRCRLDIPLSQEIFQKEVR